MRTMVRQEFQSSEELNRLMMTFNRRGFLTGAVSLAGVTTLSHSRLLAAAAAVGEPRLKFGVLSDIHLYEPGDEDTFIKALEYFRDHGADGVLIAGDIAHTGGYGQLKRCADAWKGRRGTDHCDTV